MQQRHHSVSKLYAAAEDKNLIQFYKEGNGQEVLATPQELKDHFIQLRSKRVLHKQTRTIEKMTAKGTGRHLLVHVLWKELGPYSVGDRTTKRMLQCITNTYPTQARLCQMGKASNKTCKFCNEGKAETLFHWQQMCPQFAEARQKVHNDIWAEVFPAICAHLPKEWQAFKETPMGGRGGVFSDVDPNFNHYQPDGVFLHTKDVKYVMVDLTRGYGHTRRDLRAHEGTKRKRYANLLVSLNRDHMVEFYPLACTFSGAIAETTWRGLLTRLGIKDKDQDKVLRLAMKAICTGFSTMVDIRSSCLPQFR